MSGILTHKQSASLLNGRTNGWTDDEVMVRRVYIGTIKKGSSEPLKAPLSTVESLFSLNLSRLTKRRTEDPKVPSPSKARIDINEVTMKK